MGNPIEDVLVLIQLNKEKLRLFNEILELTMLQKPAISSENVDELNSLVEKKQEKIDKINKIDEGFARHFEGIKKRYSISDIGDLDIDKKYLLQLKEVTSEAFKIVPQIDKVDKENRELAKKLFENVKEKIKGIKKGTKATSNYYKQTPQIGGYFIDKKK